MDQITEFLTYQYKPEWTGEAERIRESFTNTFTMDVRENVFDSF